MSIELSPHDLKSGFSTARPVKLMNKKMQKFAIESILSISFSQAFAKLPLPGAKTFFGT